MDDSPDGVFPPRMLWAPVLMEEAKGVNESLERLGLGVLSDCDVQAFPGRNDNWSGKTSEGLHVFVKRPSVANTEARSRLDRASHFERLRSEGLLANVPAPRFLGTDGTETLSVHEYVPSSRSVAEAVGTDDFSLDDAASLGRILSNLHGSDTEGAGVAPRRFQWPPKVLAPPLEYKQFVACSSAELEAWSILQPDMEIQSAIDRLWAAKCETFTLVHGDFRLDQVLMTANGLVISDWEEFHLGDPAADVGGYIGEWLHRAVLRIHDGDNGVIASDEAIVALGIAQLSRVTPYLTAFMSGYTQGKAISATFSSRAVAYAGWHLVDRLLAATRERSRLSAVDRAAAGIGRNALIHPEEFAQILGLQECQ